MKRKNNKPKRKVYKRKKQALNHHKTLVEKKGREREGHGSMNTKWKKKGDIMLQIHNPESENIVRKETSKRPLVENYKKKEEKEKNH